MMWTVVGMLAGVSALTAPVAHSSPRGFNENHHWRSPLVRLAINLISLTALLVLVLAPDAKAGYDIDKNGQTPNEAADKVLSITDGYVNKIQSMELVAAAVVNFCPWDKL
jgi:hypothetical protein